MKARFVDEWQDEDYDVCEKCGKSLVQKQGKLICPRCDKGDKKKMGKPVRVQQDWQ